MSSCPGITFLTRICISPIDRVALLVACNLGDLAEVTKKLNCSHHQHNSEPVHRSSWGIWLEVIWLLSYYSYLTVCDGENASAAVYFFK